MTLAAPCSYSHSARVVPCSNSLFAWSHLTTFSTE